MNSATMTQLSTDHNSDDDGKENVENENLQVKRIVDFESEDVTEKRNVLPSENGQVMSENQDDNDGEDRIEEITNMLELGDSESAEESDIEDSEDENNEIVIDCTIVEKTSTDESTVKQSTASAKSATGSTALEQPEPPANAKKKAKSPSTRNAPPKARKFENNKRYGRKPPLKRRHNRHSKYNRDKVPEIEPKPEEKASVTFRGHAEETPFSLPVTSELLKKSELDSEISRNPLGSLGRQPRSTVRDSAQAPNWSNISTELEERKETVETPTMKNLTRAWYEMPHATLTDNQIRDIRVIENRQHLDPKRFYKSTGTGRKRGELPTQVQFGTIIEGSHEFYSSRLTRRERRATITDEIMSDDRVRSFTKRKNAAIQKHANRKRRVIDPAASKKRQRRNNMDFM